MERVHRGLSRVSGARGRGGRLGLPPYVVSWLQVAPLTLVMVCLVLLPLLLMVVVSFFDYSFSQVIPAFLLDSYTDLFTSSTTYALYLKTFKFVAITWAVTLTVGFMVAYFIVFHVRSSTWRSIFMLACAIPFWTSNVIRMISWIPFLGREGVVNTVLLKMGVITQPLGFLLYSDFAVLVAYVHIMTLMMIVPIANSMGKIDKSLITAARDAGATEWQVVRNVVIPLAKSGIALGSIFVITQVMGDYFVVKLMSGGQASTAVGAISNELSAFEYPPAAAGSVVMMVVVIAVVAMVLRVVDIRKELAR